MSMRAPSDQDLRSEPETITQITGLEHLRNLAALQYANAGLTHTLGPVKLPESAPPGDASRTSTFHRRLDRLGRLWRRVPVARPVPPLLAVVLAIQAGLSLRLLWSNTAFADEALYLWAGHLEWQHWLSGTSIASQRLPAYFSGAPVIYPPIGAIADSVGGLTGARLLSLACMLGSTALLYATTRVLYGRRSAVFASGLFAGLPATQFLGAFATYDAMALFLLVLATWCGVRGACAPDRFRGVPLLVACGLAFAIANTAKYASALYDPVVIGVVLFSASRGNGARRAAAAAVIPLGTAATAIAASLLVGRHGYIAGVETTTLSRVFGETPIPAVLSASEHWVGAVAFLAICGAVAATWSRGLRDGLLGWSLAVAVFLAPVEQARIHTLTSLFKHVGYGGWFGAAIAGYALASLVSAVPRIKARKALVLGTATVAAAGTLGVALAGEHFAGWPNSTRMIRQLTPALDSVGCPCLIVQNNAVAYYLHDQTRTDIIRNAFSFFFWDKESHRELSGAPAYQAAISAHYFRVLEVDPTLNPDIYQPIIRTLATTPGYRRIGMSPSGVPDEPVQIWVLGGVE